MVAPPRPALLRLEVRRPRQTWADWPAQLLATGKSRHRRPFYGSCFMGVGALGGPEVPVYSGSDVTSNQSNSSVYLVVY